MDEHASCSALGGRGSQDSAEWIVHVTGGDIRQLTVGINSGVHLARLQGLEPLDRPPNHKTPCERFSIAGGSAKRDQQVEGTTRLLRRGRQSQQLRHEYLIGTGSPLVSVVDCG